MRIAGTVFVLIASYRSVFVSSYLGQLAWFDSIANSSLLIRGFAVFSELSFAALIMLVLLQLSKEVPASENHRTSKFTEFLEPKIPYFFFTCLFIAQFFATSGTITKIEVLFAVEETLWGLAFLSILPLSIIQLRRVNSFKDEKTLRELRLFRILAWMMSVFCLGYCSYSLFYHLPIEYWPQAIAQLKMEVPVPEIRTGVQAVKDAFFIVNETKVLADWGGIGFLIWHSGYFSLCVWMSLFLMNGPRRLKISQKIK